MAGFLRLLNAIQDTQSAYDANLSIAKNGKSTLFFAIQYSGDYHGSRIITPAFRPRR